MFSLSYTSLICHPDIHRPLYDRGPLDVVAIETDSVAPTADMICLLVFFDHCPWTSCIAVMDDWWVQGRFQPFF
ncbi:hypothetical protein C100_10075 [Sphingobium sp. C100]|nr:hypothetical protein C100_10075 [Sphingobium sp. C100]